MKKIILISIIIAVLIGIGVLIYFLIPKNQSTDNSDQEKAMTLEAKVGETFPITIIGNKNAGYEWNANYNDQDLTFVDREYVQMDESVMNGAGLEKFRFTALKEGETEIEFVFRKIDVPEEVVEKLYYVITIKPNGE